MVMSNVISSTENGIQESQGAEQLKNTQQSFGLLGSIKEQSEESKWLKKKKTHHQIRRSKII